MPNPPTGERGGGKKRKQRSRNERDQNQNPPDQQNQQQPAPQNQPPAQPAAPEAQQQQPAQPQDQRQQQNQGQNGEPRRNERQQQNRRSRRQDGQQNPADAGRAQAIEGRKGDVLPAKRILRDQKRPGEFVTIHRFGDRDYSVRIYGITSLTDTDLKKFNQHGFDLKLVTPLDQRNGEVRAVIAGVHGDPSYTFHDAANFDQYSTAYEAVEKNNLQYRANTVVRDFEYVMHAGDDDVDGHYSYLQAGSKEQDTVDGREFRVLSFWKWRPKLDQDGFAENPDIPLVVTVALPETRFYEAIPVWQDLLVREYSQLNAVASHWQDALQQLATDHNKIRDTLDPQKTTAFDHVFTRVANAGRLVLAEIQNGAQYIEMAQDEDRLDARKATATMSNEFHTHVAKAVAEFSEAMQATLPYLPDTAAPNGRFNLTPEYSQQNGQALSELRKFVDSTVGSQLSLEELVAMLKDMQEPLRFVGSKMEATHARGGESFVALREALAKLVPPVSIDIDPRFSSRGKAVTEQGVSKIVAYKLNANGSSVNLVSGDILMDIGLETVKTGKGPGQTYVTFDTVADQARRNAAIERIRSLVTQPGQESEQNAQTAIATSGYQRCTVEEFMAMVQQKVVELADPSATGQDIALLARLEAAQPTDFVSFLNSQRYAELCSDPALQGLRRKAEAIALPRLTDYVRSLGFASGLGFALQISRLQDTSNKRVCHFDITVTGIESLRNVEITGIRGQDEQTLRRVEQQIAGPLQAHREALAGAQQKAIEARRDAFVGRINNAPVPDLIRYLNGKPLNGPVDPAYETRLALYNSDRLLHDLIVATIVERIGHYIDLPVDPAVRMEPGRGDVLDSAEFTFLVRVVGESGQPDLMPVREIVLRGNAGDRPAIVQLRQDVSRALTEGRRLRQEAEVTQKRDQFLSFVTNGPLPQVFAFLNGTPLPDTFDPAYRMRSGIRDTGLADQVNTAIVARVQDMARFAPEAQFAIGHPSSTDLNAGHTFMVTVPGTPIAHEPLSLTGDARTDKPALDKMRARITAELTTEKAAREAQDLAARQDALRTHVTTADLNELIAYLNGGQLTQATLPLEYRLINQLHTVDAALYDEVRSLLLRETLSYAAQIGGFSANDPLLTFEFGHPGLTPKDPFTFVIGRAPELLPTQIQLTGIKKIDEPELRRITALIQQSIDVIRPATERVELSARLTEMGLPGILGYLNGRRLLRADGTAFPDAFVTIGDLQAKQPDLYRDVVAAACQDVSAYLGLPQNPAVVLQLGHPNAGPDAAYTFSVEVTGFMQPVTIDVTGDLTKDAANRDRVLGLIDKAIKRQEFLARNPVLTPRLGMQLRITDAAGLLERFGWPDTDPATFPTGEIELVYDEHEDLVMRIGDHVIPSHELLFLQHYGIMEVVSAPMELPDGAEQSLDATSRKFLIDPPLKPGEEFIYHGPLGLNGELTEGVRLRVVQAFEGEKYPGNNLFPEGFSFVYAGAIDTFGRVGKEGGKYTMGPSAGKPFPAETYIGAQKFAQMLNLDAPRPRFERPSVSAESIAAKEAVELLQHVADKQAIDSADFLRAIGLPTTEMGGKNVVRFLWAGQTIPAAAKEGQPLENNSVWRVIGVDEQKQQMSVARENAFGEMTGAKNVIKFSDALRAAKYFELPPAEPFYLRLARATKPPLTTPEAAKVLLGGSFRITIPTGEPELTDDPDEKGDKKKKKQAFKQFTLVLQKDPATTGSLSFSIDGTSRVAAFTQEEFLAKVLDGTVHIEPFQAAQTSRNVEQKSPAFAVGVPVGQAGLRFIEQLRARKIKIPTPLEAIQNSQFTTRSGKQFHFSSLDEQAGIVRFWTEDGAKKHKDHQLTLDLFAVAIANGQFVYAEHDIFGTHPEPAMEPTPVPGVVEWEDDAAAVNGGRAVVDQAEVVDHYTPDGDDFDNDPGFESTRQEANERYDVLAEKLDDMNNNLAQYELLSKQLEFLQQKENERSSWSGLFKTKKTYRIPVVEINRQVYDAHIPLDDRVEVAVSNTDLLFDACADMERQIRKDEQRILAGEQFEATPHALPYIRQEYIQEVLKDRFAGFTPEWARSLTNPTDRAALQTILSQGIRVSDLHENLKDLNDNVLRLTFNSYDGSIVVSTPDQGTRGSYFTTLQELASMIDSKRILLRNQTSRRADAGRRYDELGEDRATYNVGDQRPLADEFAGPLPRLRGEAIAIPSPRINTNPRIGRSGPSIPIPRPTTRLDLPSLRERPEPRTLAGFDSDRTDPSGIPIRREVPPPVPQPRSYEYVPPAGRGVEEFLNDSDTQNKLRRLPSRAVAALLFSPRIAKYMRGEQSRLEGLRPQLEQMRTRARAAKERYNTIQLDERSDFDFSALVYREYDLVSKADELVNHFEQHLGSMEQAQDLVEQVNDLEREATAIVTGYERLARI